jgi:HPt (histidine-containing phosphotransfer) domain-containing protein
VRVPSPKPRPIHTRRLAHPNAIPRAKKDLAKLSSLGHFLKGSSAALGVSRVQASCEKIQHYGNLRDEELGVNLSPQEANEKIKRLLVEVQADYRVAEQWLRDWFASRPES